MERANSPNPRAAISILAREFGSKGGTKLPVPSCGIRGTPCWGECHEGQSSRERVAVYLPCRVRHGYRVRGSNLARLGGSSGGSPPGPYRIRRTDRGRSLLLFAC